MENQLPVLTPQEMISLFNEKEFRDQFELAVIDKFLKFETKSKELTDISVRLSISSNEDLDVAKSRILDIASWTKMLVQTHKEIKSPLLEITRILDSKKKTIEETINNAKEIISTKVTFFDTIQKRAEAVRLQAELDDKLREDQLVIADTKRIERMVSNVRSLLFGGIFVNDVGTSTKPGAFTLIEVERIEEVISRSLPQQNNFRFECRQAYVDAIKIINDMIIARAESVMSTNGTVLSGKEAAILSEVGSIMEYQGERLSRENEKINRDLEKTNKGFRRVIVYDTIDINRIPREFLCVDESKINEYKIKFREEILEGLKMGTRGAHTFIEGIRFRVEQTSIVR